MYKRQPLEFGELERAAQGLPSRRELVQANQPEYTPSPTRPTQTRSAQQLNLAPPLSPLEFGELEDVYKRQVVIYDRIRETSKYNPDRPINDVIDDAVNQTLGRSINTTLTTTLTLLAIFIFGGSTLKFFSLALIIGFLLGAYSSIFIASTLLGWWRETFGSPEPEAIEEEEEVDNNGIRI